MIDLKSISKSTPKKPIIAIYGPSGIGKTTFGASAPNPIFVLTEDGLGDIEVAAIPINEETGKPRKATSFAEVLDCLADISNQNHDFKTVVVDSLDWLETLVWEATCKRLKVNSIEDPGYGRGYVEAMTDWKDFFDAITYLRDIKNMNVILIAHGAIIKIEDPIHPAYDQNTMKLHKRSMAKVEEFVDVLGFGALYTTTTSEKVGFDKTRNRAITTGERIMYVSPSVGFKAKNRYRMGSPIPLDWEEFEAHLPNFEPKSEQTKNKEEN